MKYMHRDAFTNFQEKNTQERENVDKRNGMNIAGAQITGDAM